MEAIALRLEAIPSKPQKDSKRGVSPGSAPDQATRIGRSHAPLHPAQETLTTPNFSCAHRRHQQPFRSLTWLLLNIPIKSVLFARAAKQHARSKVAVAVQVQCKRACCSNPGIGHSLMQNAGWSSFLCPNPDSRCHLRDIGDLRSHEIAASHAAFYRASPGRTLGASSASMRFRQNFSFCTGFLGSAPT